MCQPVIPPEDAYAKKQILYPGQIATAISDCYLDTTRLGSYVVQCLHEFGEWEDTPELKEGESLHLPPKTKARFTLK